VNVSIKLYLQLYNAVFTFLIWKTRTRQNGYDFTVFSIFIPTISNHSASYLQFSGLQPDTFKQMFELF